MADNLPNELLARILQLYSSKCSSLSQVSRRWRAISWPALFRHLQVRTICQLVDVGGVFGHNTGALISTEDITFSIQSGPDDEGAQSEAIVEACQCLYSLVSNNALQRLSFIKHTSPIPLSPILLMAFNCLTVSSSPFPVSLLNTPSAEPWHELVLSSVSWPKDAPEFPVIVRSKKVWAESFMDFLEAAEAKGHGDWARQLLDAEHCLTIVEHNVEGSLPSEEDSLLEIVPQGSGLRHLSLVSVSCLGSENSRIEWDGFEFSSLPDLRSLTLIIRDSDMEPLQEVIRGGLPSNLRSVLLELHIEGTTSFLRVIALLSALAELTDATLDVTICMCFCVGVDGVEIDAVRGEAYMSDDALDALDLLQESWEDGLQEYGNVSIVLPSDTIQGLLHMEESPVDHRTRMGCLCCQEC